jgi:hypothetical protein
VIAVSRLRPHPMPLVPDPPHRRQVIQPNRPHRTRQVFGRVPQSIRVARNLCGHRGDVQCHGNRITSIASEKPSREFRPIKVAATAPRRH